MVDVTVRGASSQRSRDLALDFLRGYLLVVIIVDHLRFERNPLYLISANQSLWVTAAEGFVLISAYLVGRLRGDEARAVGMLPPTRYLLRRAAKLALWCAGLTIAFRAISTATGYWPAVPSTRAPGELIAYSLDALVLHATYGDHNLLAGYAMFLALSPLAIFAMLRGRTYLVLGTSAAVWALAFTLHLEWAHSVQADLCWQFLFMIGVAAGFHHAALARRWRTLAPGVRRALVTAGVIASVAIVLGSLARPRDHGFYPTQLEQLLFDRHRLGVGRIACALILVPTLHALVRALGSRGMETLGRFFVPLGQASLYVYILQSIGSYFLVDLHLANLWLAGAISGALIGALWLGVRYRVLWGIIPR
jgi:hypothetical protein